MAAKTKKEKVEVKKKAPAKIKTQPGLKTKTAKPLRKIANVKSPAKVIAKITTQKVEAAVHAKRKPTTKRKELLPIAREPVSIKEKPVLSKVSSAPSVTKTPDIMMVPHPKVELHPKVAPKPEVITPPKITPTVMPVEKTKEEVKRAKASVPEVKVVPIEIKISAPAVLPVLKELELKLPITLKDLAVKLQEKPSVLIKMLLDMKVMVGINQILEQPLVEKMCEKFGFIIKSAPDEEELALSMHRQTDKPESLHARSPIVTLMGHVDHGKTSLLDAIRKTKVVESEHGGITQHIGAYRVALPRGDITFLDTPGHEAFTAMRARGASITDIVVLVVAADDGVMPQTQEAIDHARAAGVPIIVAVNKIDKPQANADQVKKQLSELGLTPEDWGGKTIIVCVSAKTGQGIDDLLEMILLEAQMLELKANPDKLAKGVVIEAKMSKGRGPVSTLLVQNGTLHLNDNVIIGLHYGKIRAMFNDRGQSVTRVLPSFPVEVLGISGIPQAGEQFFVVSDEKTARDLALKRQEQERHKQMKSAKKISLEDLYAQIQEGKLKELKLIVKADVQGSLQAIKETLHKLNVSEIKLDIIHEGVGTINASDTILAVASNALILGFNVAADELAKELAAKEGVDIRCYNIIYELANDIKAALEGMLEPNLKKVFLGRVDIRKVLKLSRSGIVAGCFVSKGKVNRSASINLVRNGEVIFEGKISSLKRFKDDVKEVAEGYECGITISGFDDLKEGDIIDAYEIEKVARKL